MRLDSLTLGVSCILDQTYFLFILLSHRKRFLVIIILLPLERFQNLIGLVARSKLVKLVHQFFILQVLVLLRQNDAAFEDDRLVVQSMVFGALVVHSWLSFSCGGQGKVWVAFVEFNDILQMEEIREDHLLWFA